MAASNEYKELKLYYPSDAVEGNLKAVATCALERFLFSSRVQEDTGLPTGQMVRRPHAAAHIIFFCFVNAQIWLSIPIRGEC